mmetsp:Transcript_16064/g.40450  ORF Transcript_16064/g.40450 Transcript_16064/m.40450 type:complete len:384 (+) Transcript_16064:205-1356(+)
MPRPATNPEMRKSAICFAQRCITLTGLDDDIIPKKGRFSPFEFFCKVFPACVKSSDGGVSAHGITQAAFNKALINDLGFADGMRSPFRNTEAARTGMKSSRHYLRCRWISPAEYAALPLDQRDAMFPDGTFDPEGDALLSSLLGDAFAWSQTIGAAGRGGDRSRARRDSASAPASVCGAAARAGHAPEPPSSSKSESGALSALLALASSPPATRAASPAPCETPPREADGDKGAARNTPDPMDIASLVTSSMSSTPSPSPVPSHHASPSADARRTCSPLGEPLCAAPTPIDTAISRKRGFEFAAAHDVQIPMRALVHLLQEAKRQCRGWQGGEAEGEWQQLASLSQAMRLGGLAVFNKQHQAQGAPTLPSISPAVQAREATLC